MKYKKKKYDQDRQEYRSRTKLQRKYYKNILNNGKRYMKMQKISINI